MPRSSSTLSGTRGGLPRASTVLLKCKRYFNRREVVLFQERVLFYLRRACLFFLLKALVVLLITNGCIFIRRERSLVFVARAVLPRARAILSGTRFLVHIFLPRDCYLWHARVPNCCRYKRYFCQALVQFQLTLAREIFFLRASTYCLYGASAIS